MFGKPITEILKFNGEHKEASNSYLEVTFKGHWGIEEPMLKFPIQIFVGIREISHDWMKELKNLYQSNQQHFNFGFVW